MPGEWKSTRPSSPPTETADGNRSQDNRCGQFRTTACRRSGAVHRRRCGEMQDSNHPSECSFHPVLPEGIVHAYPGHDGIQRKTVQRCSILRTVLSQEFSRDGKPQETFLTLPEGIISEVCPAPCAGMPHPSSFPAATLLPKGRTTQAGWRHYMQIPPERPLPDHRTH